MSFDASCPVPASRYDAIVMGHGGGGRLTAELLDDVFMPAFDNPILRKKEDQATLPAWSGPIAMTTDAFVVQPLFFPGGDIGALAVHGTLNDLAVGGARPRYLAASFVLEEGLPLGDLRRIVQSMGRACRADGVDIVCGDTKVVERGKGDGVFISTTGIGVISHSLSIAACRPGDRIIVSGTVGDHGVAVLSKRKDLSFATTLESDTASLVGLTQRMLEVAGDGIRCMRDPTRGGLATVLNEMARGSRTGVQLDEAAVPMRDAVRGACEMLGLDPLYVANEGKLVAVVAAEHAERLVEAMRGHPLGCNSAIVGRVVAEHPGLVSLRTAIGGERLLALLSGEQLPRIC